MKSICRRHRISGWPIWKYEFSTLFTFVSLVTLFSFSGCENSEHPAITLNRKNSTLLEVLEEIRDQSHYDLIGDLTLLESVGDVTIIVNKEPLSEVLKVLTVNQMFDIDIQNKTIVILPK